MIKTLNPEKQKSAVVQYLYWWILRAVMAVTLVYSLFRKKDMSLQLAGNLLWTFMYEIFSRLFRRTSLSSLPQYIFSGVNTLIFLGCFGGAVLGMYYSVSWYNTLLHFLGGAWVCIIGEELLHTQERKHSFKSSFAVTVIFAVGVSFILASAWEIFEFSCDQLTGGDTQHWSYTNAMLNKTYPTFNPKSIERFGLMDTMSDIIFNTLGAAAAAVFIAVKIKFKSRGGAKAKAVKKQNIANERSTAPEKLKTVFSYDIVPKSTACFISGMCQSADCSETDKKAVFASSESAAVDSAFHK